MSIIQYFVSKQFLKMKEDIDTVQNIRLWSLAKNKDLIFFKNKKT
jgi:hypothetical protein